MRIIMHELRKIWNIKIFAIIVAICVLYAIGTTMPLWMRSVRDMASDPIIYEMVTRHSGRHMTNDEFDAYIMEWGAIWENTGRGWVEHGTVHDDWDRIVHRIELAISRELWEWRVQLFTDAAATNTTEEIFALTARLREPLIAEANMHIAGNPIFAANGIFSYDDYLNRPPFTPWTEIEASRAEILVADAFTGKSSNFVGTKLFFLEDVEWLAKWYENGEHVNVSVQERLRTVYLPELLDEEVNERQRERLLEILEADEYRSVLPGRMFWNLTVILHSIALMLIFSSLALHSPPLTIDRMRKIVPLQIHAKIGRRITIRQFAATLISAVLLTTLFLVIFSIYLWQAGVFVYWNQGLTSFLTHQHLQRFVVTFRPMTFGSYMLIWTAVFYALSIGTAAVAFALSRFSRNLIALTIKIIPAMVVLYLLHGITLPHLYSQNNETAFNDVAPFTMWNNLYLRTGIAHLDWVIIAIFAVAAIITAWVLSMCDNRRKAVEL